MDDDELSKILEGDSDAGAVRAYRALEYNPGALASLAANLAAKHEKSDPSELSEAALALWENAERTLIRKRERIVSSMNYETLLTLARELSALDTEDAKKKRDDPIAGPVIRRLRDILTASIRKKQRQNEENVAEALKNAGARTGLRRPKTPCGLESALRYATNLPRFKCPWPLLESAFMDFLTIGKDIVRLESVQEEELERERQDIESILTADSEHKDAIHKHTRRLEKIASALARIKDARAFRRTFKPGKKPPGHLKERVERIFEEYWQASNSVSDCLLASICTEYPSFWREHGSAYLALYDREKERAAKARASGQKRAEQRDRDTWIERTEMFIAFVREEGGIPVAAEVSGFINRFAKERAGVKHSATRKRVRSFFEALLNAKDPKFDGDTSELLKNVGLPTKLTAVHRECLAVFLDAIP